VKGHWIRIEYGVDGNASTYVTVVPVEAERREANLAIRDAVRAAANGLLRSIARDTEVAA
jgi:uncharacterized small protein (DUF1192 family)